MAVIRATTAAREKTGSGIKLNLGCGLIAPRGWVNIDNSPNAWLAKRPLLQKMLYWMRLLPKETYLTAWPSNVIVYDVRNGLPYGNGEVSTVYASHLLVALPLEEGIRLLRESYRVLKEGGILRLVCLDVFAMVMEYVESNLALQCEDNVPEDLTSLPLDTLLRRLNLGQRKRLCLRDRIAGDSKQRRKWLYDQYSLKAYAKSCGFHCESKDYLDSAIEDINAVERSQFSGAFCLECIKRDGN